jgi:hypothetical protein
MPRLFLEAGGVFQLASDANLSWIYAPRSEQTAAAAPCSLHARLDIRMDAAGSDSNQMK